MADQKDTKAVNVRVPVAVLEKVAEMANKERRSLSAQVIIILEQAVSANA